MTEYQQQAMRVPSLIYDYVSQDVFMMIPALVLIGAVLASLVAVFAGIFMLRRSKASEIEELWQEM